ncbi:MAG: non-heme iron oxygenase ferredoxin subunit [Pseudomonadota bacterium]
MSSNTPEWTDAAAENEVTDWQMLAVPLADREIALFSVDGAIYATDNLCTHGNARLCDGFLEGTEIECPLHQGRFDVRTGTATCAPATGALRTYPVKTGDGRVWIKLA